MIVLFKGTISEIPDGWILCDGANGTPNLVDKFICMRNTMPVGNSQVILNDNHMPSHEHIGVTIGYSGNHSHSKTTYRSNSIENSSSRVSGGIGDSAGTAHTRSYNNSHSHSIQSVGATGSSVAIPLNPRFIYLLFIKFVG